MASSTPRSSGRRHHRAVDHDVAVVVDLRDQAGRDDGGRVVLFDDRRPFDPIGRHQLFSLVEPGRPAIRLAARVEDHLALERQRPRGVPVATLQTVGPQLGNLADGHRADVDQLYLRFEAVAVLGLVRAVEAVGQFSEPGRVDLAGRDVEAHLVALTEVTAVGQPTHQAATLGDPVLCELALGLSGQLLIPGPQPFEIGARNAMALGGYELVLEVGGQEPRRRDDTRVPRHQHLRNLELHRDVAGEQRSRATRRDEHEFARVIAASDRVELDRLRHAELLDLERAQRGLLHRHPQAICQLAHGAVRELTLEAHVSAQKPPIRTQPAQQKLSVGGGRFRPSARVAGRSGVGARRLRTDAEHLPLVDVGDRAAARADRVDVDHGDHRLVVADLGVKQMAHPQLPTRGHADVGGGSADVERDHVVEARQAPRPDAADQPRHRPRHQQVDRPQRRRLDRRHTAGGLHELDAVLEAVVSQGLVEPRHVPRDLRSDVRVQRDCRESLKLAVEREHLVRYRQIAVGVLLEHDLLDPPLVGGVEVGVKKTDGYRLDAGSAQRPHALAHLLLVERRQHLAVGHGDPLGDREAVASLDQRA